MNMNTKRPMTGLQNDKLLIAMLTMAQENQDRLNKTLAEDWADKPWEYGKAIAKEASEILDHTRWEWWKHKDHGQFLHEDQRRAIHMELCDILHFGLSSNIKRGVNPRYILDAFMLAGIGGESRKGNGYVNRYIGTMFFEGIAYDSFDMDSFAGLCNAFDLSLEELLVYYFAKTALNEFRWANGYKEKTYVKMWAFPDSHNPPCEDNDHLCDFLQKGFATVGAEDMLLSVQTGAFSAGVKDHLAELYAKIVKP